MPIKIPKGFARRKSSGNVLEESENRPQSSFRVIDRPSMDARSLSEGNLLAPKSAMTARRSSQPLEAPDDNLFTSSPRSFNKNRYALFVLTYPDEIIQTQLTGHSDSGGTDTSAVTAGTYESSSSLRFSSSSTSRPSNEVQAPENTHSSQSRGFHDIPPLTGALRAAGRTLSFGGRFYKNSAPQQQPPQQDSSKTRTMTATTPPKILETDLNLKLGKESDFQSMLEDFGSPKQASFGDELVDPV